MFKNLLPKDLGDEERPAHEGQGIEEDDPAGNQKRMIRIRIRLEEDDPAGNDFMSNSEGSDLGRQSTYCTNSF